MNEMTKSNTENARAATEKVIEPNMDSSRKDVDETTVPDTGNFRTGVDEVIASDTENFQLNVSEKMDSSVDSPHVRYAHELESLDELHLSKKTLEMCKKFSSIEEVVTEGRRIAYYSTQEHEMVSEWKEELASALMKANFVRTDITKASFGLGALYSRVYPYLKDQIIYDIEGLFEDEDRYENFVNPSQEKIDAVKNAISDSIHLNSKTADIILRRYGLYDGEIWSTTRIAFSYNNLISKREISYIESEAISVLKYRNILPSVLEVINHDEEPLRRIQQLSERLAEIRQDPLYKEMVIARLELEHLAGTPFEYSNEAREAISEIDNSYLCCDMDVRDLPLSTRALNCMSRANIRTVADVVKYPMNKWRLMRNLGAKTAIGIEDAIRDLGIKLFRISL